MIMIVSNLIQCRERQVSLLPKTRQTTRLFEIQIITLMTKFQIYVCVLVLLSYMIFWGLMTLNNIVSFLNVEPKTAIRLCILTFVSTTYVPIRKYYTLIPKPH
jgi:hypothetical protein